MSFDTPRLKFRRWQDADRAHFANMNADSEVMRHFPAPLSESESDELVDRIEEGFEEHGFGLWAVDRRDTREFIGFIGLSVPSFKAEFTPCVEVGWRLAKAHWGRGFATEGAKKILQVGFDHFDLDEIVSFTARSNLKSIRVMERIGLNFVQVFDHPSLSPDSPIYAHVLYKATKAEQCY